MPTINLLEMDARLRNSVFRDANGNLPVIKSRNRLGNYVYQIPNDNAQIVYCILMYELSDQRQDIFDRIVSSPIEYRMRLNSRVRVERVSQTDWSALHNNHSDRPRRFTGLKFIVEIPNRGSWGRWTPSTTRTVSVVDGKITLHAINRVLGVVTDLLDHHVEQETERQTAERIRREARELLANQANTFMQGIIEHYPLEPMDGYSWHNDYNKINISITLDKFQIAKVLDAIHNVRHGQINPLDAEYLLKKDY